MKAPTDDVHEPEGQPCLELEARADRVGALFRLAGEAFIGNSWRAHVPIMVPGLSERHARVYSLDGTWFLEDVKPRLGTSVNGARIDGGPRPLQDGDRISLDRDLAVLRFHATRPPLIGVACHGAHTQEGFAWVTFCPWSADPRLDYAMSHDGRVCTACADDRVSTFTSRTFAAIGVRARLHDRVHKRDVVIYDDDIAGIRWPDLLWRTNEQRATVDGRLLLATAALMMRGGDLFYSRMHVAWSGALVWHARAAPATRAPPRTPGPSPGLPPLPRAGPPPAPRPTVTEHDRNAARAAHLAHLVATAAGCIRVRRSTDFVTPDDVGVLLDHRKALATLALESDVRAALARMIDAALASPHDLGEVIERERMALGVLEPASIAGLVARLFPEEHAEHQRIVEEARLLGVDGIGQLQR